MRVAQAGIEPASKSDIDDAPRSRRFWLTMLTLVVLAGAGFRIRQYAARASFFRDEASLVLNFHTHTARQLVGTLDYGQAAPPIFLWIGRAMYVRFGPNEFALRLLPLTAGLASLLLFAILVWRVLPSPIAVFAAGWFAFCEKLISYCAELKQYSGDALVAVVLLAIVLLGRKRRSAAERLLVLSIVSAIALWFSHPTIVLFGGLALILLPQCLRAGTRATVIGLAGCALVALSFLTIFFLSIRHQHDQYLFSYWAPSFPDGFRPIGFVLWLARQTYELLNTPYRDLGFVFLILGLCGLLFARIERRGELLGFCIAPIGLTILAACLRQYPYNGSRLTMFLFPGLFLLCAAGADGIRRRLGIFGRLSWAILPAVVLVVGVVQAAGRAVDPRFNSHIRPVVRYVRARFEPGEGLYLLGERGPADDPLDSPGRHQELLAYWPDPPAVVHTRLASPADIHEPRFWVVLAFRPQTRKEALQLFDRMKTVADPVGKPFVVRQGGAACLFELRKPANRVRGLSTDSQTTDFSDRATPQ